MGGEIKAPSLDELFDFSELEELGQFDDERILQGLVTKQELFELEGKLIKNYFEKAKAERKEFILIKNQVKYRRLKEAGEVVSEKSSKFYLLVDGYHNVLDMVPVAYHLLDTEEGRFYAKLMPLDECHQLQEQS